MTLGLPNKYTTTHRTTQGLGLSSVCVTGRLQMALDNAVPVVQRPVIG